MQAHTDMFEYYADKLMRHWDGYMPSRWTPSLKVTSTQELKELLQPETPQAEKILSNWLKKHKRQTWEDELINRFSKC